MKNLSQEEEKNYKLQYNITEYAVGNKFNRHHFHEISNDHPYNNKQELYKSIFRHSNEIKEYFDSHLKDDGKKTLGGYCGAVWADQVVIDIDYVEDLNEAHTMAKKLLLYIESEYDVDLFLIDINFSGNKGFHIRIPAVLFGGFEASPILNEKIKLLVAKLCDNIIDFDSSIYDTTRLVRVVNTKNDKSELYSIPLTKTELFKFNIDEIKELAKSPREDFEYGYDEEELEPNEEFVRLKEEILNSISFEENDSLDNDDNQKESKEKDNYWEPQSEGGRHQGLVRLVGHLADHLVGKDNIIEAARCWNNNNTPPLDEKRLSTELENAFKSYGNIEGPFFTIRQGKSFRKESIKINMELFIQFLGQNGYAKKYFENTYAFVKIVNNIVDEVEDTQIKDMTINYLRSYKISQIQRTKLLDQIISRSGFYFGIKQLECLKSIDWNMRNATKVSGFLYYKNGFVVLKKNDAPIIKPYSEMKGYIFRSQIVKRDIKLSTDKTQEAVYEQFLFNVAGKSQERLKTIKSAIGYLLHGFKDNTNTKAIVLLDEKIPENGEPNGRTGKSLFGRALREIKKTTRIDGKNFEFNSKFTFQQVDLDSKIVEFNDVKKNFSFESLFSVITDDMSIENKGARPLRCPFEDSPKFLISTNYTIKGKGSSYTDRLFEIEFSDHYTENHKPENDFGHQFFSNAWDSEEWNRFDNFMLECLQLYLDEGLVSYKKVNLAERKLIDATSPEFVEFAKENIKTNTEYIKQDLFFDFVRIYDMTKLFQRTFTNWLKLYADFIGIEITERKSNSKCYVTLGSSIKSVDAFDENVGLFD